jgi:hypothetical protein
MTETPQAPPLRIRWRPRSTPWRRRHVFIGAAMAVVAAATIAFWPRPSPEPVASGLATVDIPLSAPTPTRTPAPTGFPADTAAYDLAALPDVNVFAILPALQTDTAENPDATGETARATAEAIPVWSDPAAAPVARLGRDYRYGGTTVPVIERQEHWVRVLLTGRQSLPSAGDPGQVTGWLRVQDVEFGLVDSRIEVDLSDRTVDIVSAAGTERVAADFAWGREDTPTPIGRSFIMLVETVSFAYTRGHPMVYLSVHSPTIDDFDDSDAAVTAFHYHDARTGAISNGCIRLDGPAIDRLAQLPVGTPVTIRE